MASLLFRLRGGSPRNGPLVIDPHALAEAPNKKGGRGLLVSARKKNYAVRLMPRSPAPSATNADPEAGIPERLCCMPNSTENARFDSKRLDRSIGILAGGSAITRCAHGSVLRPAALANVDREAGRVNESSVTEANSPEQGLLIKT
jgi:hypothetical protein